MSFARKFALAVLLIAASGCRSHVIQVMLINTGPQPVSTIVVDYPGATFGVDSLAPGKSYRYTIKPTDRGAVKIQFVDAQGGNHTFAGPTVEKGQEGSIEIRINQGSASAEPSLR
ncbi:MAG TPA: hypothetical protein VKD24_08175 [Candidatus Angelobacter sp.]|nr:hypothetical protein [Candidatus Angelobacter sp.]